MTVEKNGNSQPRRHARIGPSNGEWLQLLAKEGQLALKSIASVVRFKRGEHIYRKGQQADAILFITNGVVKTYTNPANGREHIFAFLFANDLLGSFENERYINSARAITPVAAYRLPLSSLARRLPEDAGLKIHIICKLCNRLRQAQRHALVIANSDSSSCSRVRVKPSSTRIHSGSSV
jgi:CRP-like cAMP-binding protein